VVNCHSTYCILRCDVHSSRIKACILDFVASLNYVAVVVYQRLQCPYTQNVDDSWILELIFTPGEPRIRILQWLFIK